MRFIQVLFGLYNYKSWSKWWPLLIFICSSWYLLLQQSAPVYTHVSGGCTWEKRGQKNTDVLHTHTHRGRAGGFTKHHELVYFLPLTDEKTETFSVTSGSGRTRIWTQSCPCPEPGFFFFFFTTESSSTPSAVQAARCGYSEIQMSVITGSD